MNDVVSEFMQTATHELQALPPHGEMRCILSKVLSLIPVAYDEGYKDGCAVGREDEANKPPRSGNSSKEK